MAKCELNNSNSRIVDELAEVLGSREAATKYLRNELVENRQTSVKFAQRYKSILDDMESFDGTADEAFTWMLVSDPKNKASYANIDKLSESIEKSYQAKMYELLEALSTHPNGSVKNKQLHVDIVREISGKDTGNAVAKKGAKKWAEVSEEMRVRFNANGGNIGKIDGWWFPQTHNQVLINKAGKEEWKSFVKSRLDLEAMKKENPLMDIDDALDGVYFNITDNTGFRPKGSGRGGRAAGNIALRHQEKRFLLFQDAEFQLEYHAKFGNNADDLGSAMVGHIGKMSNEIALMERLGPQPQRMIDKLSNSGKINMAHRITRTDATNEGLWKVVSGQADQAQSIKFAENMSAARSWMTATKLGSATLASVADLATSMSTAGFWGMPRFGTFTSRLKGLSKSDAAHMGFVSDTIANRSFVLNRFSGEADNVTHGFPQKMAETVLRITGLSAWTEGMRKGFILNTSHWFGKMSKSTFSQLPAKNQKLLKAYGISSSEWNKLRTSARQTIKGNDYIVHSAIEDLDLADRWMRMLQTETSMAVPTPDARVRAIATGGGAQKGSILGEVARSVSQFKSFPLQIMKSNLSRAVGSKGDRNLAHLAEFLMSTTTMGFMAFNLKQIAAGREPVNPFDMEGDQNARLLIASMIQGGGGGMMGDLILALFEADGFKANLLEDIAGPLAGDGIDFLKLTVGNGADFIFKDEPTNFLPELLRFGLKEIPGNNIFYGKEALKRLFNEYIMSELDPNFQKKINKQRRHMQDNLGQDFIGDPTKLF